MGLPTSLWSTMPCNEAYIFMLASYLCMIGLPCYCWIISSKINVWMKKLFMSTTWMIYIYIYKYMCWFFFMKMKSTCFLMTLTSPVSCLILENIITQSQTIAQGQAPSHVSKIRWCSWKWYQKLGTKDSTFTSSSHVRLNSYSAVETSWLWNQQFCESRSASLTTINNYL